MSDYDTNLAWTEKFIENFNELRYISTPELSGMEIRLSKHEKHTQFFVIASYQTPTVCQIATPLTMFDVHNVYKKNFKTLFAMYYDITTKNNNKQIDPNLV